ncbi:hypothetical protein [Anaplasma phagocytophilum]|uniref:hypothetical protein n=1 Tax=Anaplasma phagocytophilum TaxID=948 RepID=UPI0015DE9BA4
MEISHSEIDGKICVTKNGHSTLDRQQSYGTCAPETDRSAENKTETALCGGKGGNSATQTTAQKFKDFVAKTLVDGSQNWPTSTGGAKATGEPVTNDNAKAVADDLTKKLTSEEKTIVAGLLAKTIEGGEVVEIREVSFYLHLNRSVL